MNRKRCNNLAQIITLLLADKQFDSDTDSQTPNRPSYMYEYPIYSGLVFCFIGSKAIQHHVIPKHWANV